MPVQHQDGAFHDFDEKRYGRLLTQTMPAVLEDDDDAERTLRFIERFLSKGEENLSPEEHRLLRLLLVLVQDFEDRHFPMIGSKPLDRLKHLMREQEVQPKDLYFIFGNSSRTKQVLEGQSMITHQQAERLAKFFGAPLMLFL